MKAVDIELTPCTEGTVEVFSELDATAFPSVAKSLGERADAVRNDPRCPIDRYFLARVGGDVVGGFRILPLEMKVADHAEGWIQVGGLGRIAVYPQYRRLGYAGGVMRLVLQRSHGQGDVLSLLYPTSFSIYRKHGYGMAARHVLYSVPPRAFPDDPGREHIRPVQPGDAEAINRCYENQVTGSLGILRRNQRVWAEHYLSRSVDEGHTHWVYDAGRGPEAYIGMRYKATAKYFIQRLQVSEWFVGSNDGLRACLGFFRAQSANIELVKLPAPVGFALESALVEPVWTQDPDLKAWHQPIGKLCSTMMGRIIRVREAVAARGFAEDGRVNLLVEDWGLPQNSGYYSLMTKDGRGELAKGQEQDPDIRLDIAVFSSLYCGALTAEQALLFGLIESSPAAARQLDRMLGSSSFMVWDYF